MSLKLYYDLLSQPCRALYIFFKVCNIPFEKKIVNLGKGEHLTPEFETINPFKKIPVVEHNGFKMIESIAILRYICREYEVSDHWYPGDSKSQLKVDEFLEWQHLNVRAPCTLYFRAKYVTPILTGQPTSEEKLKSYEKHVNKSLQDLENIWLKDTNYLAGSKISIADILGSCEVEQVRITGCNPFKDTPRIAAWLERIANETSPYYHEAHVLLNKLAKKRQENELKSKI